MCQTPLPYTLLVSQDLERTGPAPRLLCSPLGPKPWRQDFSQTEGAISFRHAMHALVTNLYGRSPEGKDRGVAT